MSNQQNTADTTPEIDLLGARDSALTAPEATSLTVRGFGRTDRGLVRPDNQDQFLIAVLSKAMRVQQSSLPSAKAQYADDQVRIFVVADGIGGSSGGQEANALAVHSAVDVTTWPSSPDVTNIANERRT